MSAPQKLRKTPFYQKVDNFVLPGAFLPRCFHSTVNYKPQSDDVFIVTYPKCGTTWTQQIVSLLFFEGESTTSYQEFNMASPFMELLGAEVAEFMPRPFSIKVHLPFNLCPFSKDAKYIYATRNPRDTCTSFYYHTRDLIYDFEDGTFDDFFECFIKGEVEFGDYFDHLLSWWEHRNEPNILFLVYEEMKNDHKGAIEKIAKFLGPPYDKFVENPENMEKMLKFSSVNHMKTLLNPGATEIFGNPDKILQNPNLPDSILEVIKTYKEVKSREGAAQRKPDQEVNFVRKGQVGDWKNHFNEEQLRRLDQRMEQKIKERNADITDLTDIWKKHGCM